MTSYQFFYGRFFRVIYGRLETAHIWLSETHMRFFRAIYLRLETTSYEREKKFPQNGRFFRVIYGRLETAYIWLSETHMRFFRAIYWRLETTSYESFQTVIYRCFTNSSYGRFITLYVRCVITIDIRRRNISFFRRCFSSDNVADRYHGKLSNQMFYLTNASQK